MSVQRDRLKNLFDQLSGPQQLQFLWIFKEGPSLLPDNQFKAAMGICERAIEGNNSNLLSTESAKERRLRHERINTERYTNNIQSDHIFYFPEDTKENADGSGNKELTSHQTKQTEDMKKLIHNTAMLIMERTGSCSSLTVKNALFDVFLGEGNPNGTGHLPLDPSFQTNQKEVSAIISELYVENNWERTLNTSGPNSYYEYSLPVTSQDDGLFAGLTFELPDDIPVVHPHHGKTLVPPITLKTGDSKNVSPSAVTAVTTFPSASAQVATSLDKTDGERVAFVAGKPELYIQGVDKKKIRRACFQKFNLTEIGLTYDDIRQCSTGYYNNNHVVPRVIQPVTIPQ